MIANDFRPIAGFPGYFIGGAGEVLSFRRGMKFLRQNPDSHGYPQVGLYADGKEYKRRVHTLVAAAFIGPCPDGHEICHNDGTRTNNNVGNLRYGTKVENVEDRKRHGRKVGPSFSKLSQDDVRAIKSDPRTNKTAIARDYGVSRRLVGQILNGERWSDVN